VWLEYHSVWVMILPRTTRSAVSYKAATVVGVCTQFTRLGGLSTPAGGLSITVWPSPARCKPYFISAALPISKPAATTASMTRNRFIMNPIIHPPRHHPKQEASSHKRLDGPPFIYPNAPDRGERP